MMSRHAHISAAALNSEVEELKAREGVSDGEVFTDGEVGIQGSLVIKGMGGRAEREGEERKGGKIKVYRRVKGDVFERFLGGGEWREEGGEQVSDGLEEGVDLRFTQQLTRPLLVALLLDPPRPPLQS